MDNRKWQANAKAGAPTVPASPSSGFPGNGGVGDPPTTPGDWWYHQVGEELRGVIVGAGLTPTHSDVTQLLTAIKKGFGQTWQNMTGSRVPGTTYTNTTGMPIFINVFMSSSSAVSTHLVTINGASPAIDGGSAETAARNATTNILIPAGATYSVTVNVGTPTLAQWYEYR